MLMGVLVQTGSQVFGMIMRVIVIMMMIVRVIVCSFGLILSRCR